MIRNPSKLQNREPYHIGPRTKKPSVEESCVPYYKQDQNGFTPEQCCQVIDELPEEQKEYFMQMAKWLTTQISGLGIIGAQELIVKYHQWMLSPKARAYQDRYSMRLVRMHERYI